jgi:hypothetical protein
MNEVDQLASAMLVAVLAAVLLVTGHWYMENQAQRLSATSTAQMVSAPPFSVASPM